MKSYLLKTVLLLAVLCTATAIHAHDFEAVNEDGVTIYYNIISTTDKTCEVTYNGSNNGDKYSGVVNIPETATYSSISFKVTSIRSQAFWFCSGLTSVAIPNSVTSIGSSAFMGCRGLNKVIVNDIEAWCNIKFSNSESNPLVYAHHLFSDENTEITKIIIPNSVTSIGHNAFRGCRGLTSVTIPNSVTSIGFYAFSSCI